MTPQQRRTLDFIEAYYARHRVGPTMREIQAAEGLASPSGAFRRVCALLEKGHLVRDGAGPRALVPVGATMRAIPTEHLMAELVRRRRIDA